MVKFTYLCKDKTQREHMVFSVENKFTDKLISALWDEFSTEFEIFVSSTLEKKYKQFSHSGPGSAAYDARELTFRKENHRPMELLLFNQKNTNAVLQLFSTALNWGLVWENVV